MKKVLVVDDEKDFCHFLKKNLEGAGDFDVDVCYNGTEGVKKAKQLCPDIVLLDILMPGLDGGDVVTILRNDAITKSIPVIFITALAKKYSFKNREQALDGGVFISKPVRIQELVESINKLVA